MVEFVSVECPAHSAECSQDLSREDLSFQICALHQKVEGIASRCLFSLTTLNKAIAQHGINSGDAGIELCVLLEEKNRLPPIIAELKSLVAAWKIANNSPFLVNWVNMPLQTIRVTSGLTALCSTVAHFSSKKEGEESSLLTTSCVAWAICAISSFLSDLFKFLLDNKDQFDEIGDLIGRDIQLISLLLETITIAQGWLAQNERVENFSSGEEGQIRIIRRIPPRNLRKRIKAHHKSLTSFTPEDSD